MRKRTIAQILIILFAHIAVWGQEYELEAVSLEAGLSQSSVTAIAQDKRGFLWLGTQDGLNRYDGYGFKIFKKQAFDSTSLATNFITALLIDKNENLWVGTLSGGLHLYIPKTESFIRFKPLPGDSTSIIHENITSLFEDNDGNIYVGTATGICQIKWLPQKNTPSVLFNKIPYPTSLEPLFPSDRYIRKIFVDSKKQLWLGTLNGLFCFKKNAFNQLAFVQKYFADNRISAVGEGANGTIWVGMKKGLYQLNLGEQTFRIFEKGIENQVVNEIKLLKNKDLVVATEGGLGILHFKNDRYEQVFEKFEIQDDNSGRFCAIKNIQEDLIHPNLFWLGTPFSGLRKMKKKVQQFHTNHLDEVPGLSLNPSVKSILKDTAKNLWLVLEQGILKYSEEAQHYQFFSEIWIGDVTIPGNSLHRLWLDSQGQMWGGTLGHGLLKLFETQNQLVATPYFTARNCDDDAAFSFLELEDGFLIGTYSGLNFLNKKTQQLLPCAIRIDSANAEKLNYRVNDILFDTSGNLWIGTSYGLIFLQNVGQEFPENLKQAKKQFFRHDAENPESLIDNDIHHVFQDSKGRIWLGTMMGLVKVVQNSKGIQFEVFDKKHGLPNSMILGIQEDEVNQELWLSTTRGLSRLDPLLNYFFNFDRSDGLQSNEFKAGSLFKSPDGEMYFGGVNGFTRFDPQSIQLLAQPPPVWITSLSTVEGSKYNLLLKQEHRKVSLNHRQNSFTIDFTGLDYLHPQALQYFYDFEGGGAQNVPIDKARQVSFSNLKPGTYTFKVRALSKDRALNNKGDKVTIIIAAPFWETSLFYGMLILLVAGIFWLVFNIRYRMKMKRIAEIERVRKDAAEDFHDELGSKLTVISMYSELTRRHLNGNNEESGKYLKKVIDTSNNLYSSMKDLLWALNPEKDSLEDLFLELKSVGNELFEDSEILFSSNQLPKELKKTQLPIQIKRHVLLIFKEVMNNALKHSNCKTAKLNIQLANNQLNLEFRDDGKGFDFETDGNGAGLSNIQNRARKIGGHLTIISNQQGTMVKLICPLIIPIKHI